MSEAREEEAFEDLITYDLVVIGKTAEADEFCLSLTEDISNEQAVELLYQAIDQLEGMIQKERDKQ